MALVYGQEIVKSHEYTTSRTVRRGLSGSSIPVNYKRNRSEDFLRGILRQFKSGTLLHYRRESTVLYVRTQPS